MICARTALEINNGSIAGSGCSKSPLMRSGIFSKSARSRRTLIFRRNRQLRRPRGCGEKILRRVGSPQNTTVSETPFDVCHPHVGYYDGMDVERTIDDIEQLEEMFKAPDIRPLNATDLAALNRRHDEMLAHSPWFRLWQRYGVCCRVESPVVQLGGVE